MEGNNVTSQCTSNVFQEVSEQHSNSVKDMSDLEHPRSYSHLLPTVGCKKRVREIMKGIQDQKVTCLKIAILDLQRQNELLSAELRQRDKQTVKTERGSNTTLHKSHPNAENQLVEKWSTQEESEHSMDTVLISNGYQNTTSLDIPKPKETTHLKNKIRLLEEEVLQQKLLCQQKQHEINALSRFQSELNEKFQRKLRSQRKKIYRQIKTLLIEGRTQFVVSQANEGAKRAKQLEHYISTLEGRFRDTLLNVQARSSIRHQNAQNVIGDLEKKLTTSFTFP